MCEDGPAPGPGSGNYVLWFVVLQTPSGKPGAPIWTGLGGLLHLFLLLFILSAPITDPTSDLCVCVCVRERLVEDAAEVKLIDLC